MGKIEENRVQFISEGNKKCIKGEKSIHAFEEITKNLTAGSYFIRIKILWKSPTKYNTATLGAYSNQNIQF